MERLPLLELNHPVEESPAIIFYLDSPGKIRFRPPGWRERTPLCFAAQLDGQLLRRGL